MWILKFTSHAFLNGYTETHTASPMAPDNWSSRNSQELLRLILSICPRCWCTNVSDLLSATLPIRNSYLFISHSPANEPAVSHKLLTDERLPAYRYGLPFGVKLSYIIMLPHSRDFPFRYELHKRRFVIMLLHSREFPFQDPQQRLSFPRHEP